MTSEALTAWGLNDLRQAVEKAAHLLPAQGPINAFVHHNTLHAFESMPFERAVLEALKIYHCQPYMAEDWYRQEYSRGRIGEDDLVWAVERSPLQLVGLPAGISERDLKLTLLRYPLHTADGVALDWHLNETGALWRLRSEVAPAVRALLSNKILTWATGTGFPWRSWWGDWPGERETSPQRLLRSHPEKVIVRLLWRGCQKATEHLELTPPAPQPILGRHREHLVQAGLGDVDLLVNPLLIKFCAAFLDQGMAEASMPGRELGFYPCFLALYSSPGLEPRWAQGLRQALLDLQERKVDELTCAFQSLQLLGIQSSSLADYITETVLVLKGWAGMLEQNQQRPDRMPVLALPASLMEFLAVRLLLERFAVKHLCPDIAPCDLRKTYPLSTVGPRSRKALTFQLFQLCQFLSISPLELSQWKEEEIRALLSAAQEFSSLERRRCFQLAYERHFRVNILNALGKHAPNKLAQQPHSFQAIFCMDEREESTRRHLEEVAPECQTYGTPGFFSILMYFKALHENYARPLCPVAIRPRHLVEEVAAHNQVMESERRAALRKSLGLMVHSLEVGSKSLTWGSLVTSGLGMVTALPTLFRLVMPWFAGKIEKRVRQQLLPEDTRLLIERTELYHSGEGLWPGFLATEMAEIVAGELENIGLVNHFCPIVLVVGHGSSSLNNPHEAAYDCGACGGGRGGPNARVFAWMANHAPVRRLLAVRGIQIPDQTRFVGAYHNTCAEEMDLYDLEPLTPGQLQALEKAAQALQRARALDALERCRRFLSASLDLTPRQALLHVEGRAADLAQPRPELGHATNAACVVGHRDRTRGLFLDRRVFLTSYDCRLDHDGKILERVARAVVPVVAGISLEYYFSRVDNAGYGCGSKLPHNITSLLGVMEGFSSDLRTGLPKQMIEIHEPMRLLLVLEAPLPWINALLQRPCPLQLLVENEWIQLAQLDPDSQKIAYRERGNWLEQQPLEQELPVALDSAHWFHHHREDLEVAEIGSRTDHE